MKKECPICGAAALVEKRGEFYFEPPANIPGGTIIILNSKWEQCEACSESILPPELLEKLDKQRYVRLGLLSPSEIKAIRERADLSQAQISKILGVGEKTYTRWESGRLLQNKSSDNLIRLFALDPSWLERLESQRRLPESDLLRSYLYTMSTKSAWSEKKPITTMATSSAPKGKHSLQAA
jgi:putative zinc finger/helix-turn-helix YgiT family protein